MALKETSQIQREVQQLLELRIVLLGGRNSGKSLVGNTILNQEEFVLHERTTCLKRKAGVQGRSVTVVDTPGWWCDFSAQDTPELIRREIRHSISLSLPGPHAFLLVVKTDSLFIEKRRRALEEHLELLGEKVWNHIILLFTNGRNSRSKSFEEHVKVSGKPLQWLLEKCGGRFHVLDVQGTCNATKGMELMGKIDKMVAEKGGCHFEMDINTLQEVEDRKKEVERKAHQRLIKMHMQRSVLKAHSDHLQNIRLVLLGAKGSGRSSTGNSILAAGSDLRFTAKSRTTRNSMKTCTVAGREVSVVDTPGWWMNYFTQDSSAFDKQEIVTSMFLCPPGPHAFLIVVRVDRSFTQTYRRAIQEHMEMLNKDIWNHTIVVFSFGDWLGETTIEQQIESEGKALQWLVEKCEYRYHVLNNKSLGNKFQITELLEKIEDLTARNASHFKIDKSILKEYEKKRQEKENRVKLRCESVLRRSESLSAFRGQVHFPTPIRVILLGGKLSGKTSAADCILGTKGQETDRQIPVRGSVTFKEKIVEVVDTTGWTSECRNTAEFGRELLSDWVSGWTNGICILLLVVNASSSFMLKNLKAIKHHLHTLGENAWSSTIVLFTHGDWLRDISLEEYIESEGNALQTLVDKCGNRYHVFNNKIKDDGTQVVELMQKIEETVVEQMLNSAVNREKIERPLENDKLHLDGGIQIEAEIATNIHHVTDEPKNTNTDISLLHGQNQILPSSSIQLCNRNLFHRSNSQRLVVLVNTCEWNNPYEQRTGVSGTDRPESDSLAVLHVTLAKQPINESQMPRNKSQENFCEWSLPQSCITYTDKTAKQKAFVDFVQSRSLQDLIDQWGDSNIKELESFIDSYFEMVWQETMKEAEAEKYSNTTLINRESPGITETDQRLLASIDSKLSKLDILEDIQRDLQDLKKSFKHCSRIFQELKERSKETHDSSQSSETEGSAESEQRGLDEK